MEVPVSKPIHPLLIIAAIAVILFSAAGIAAIMGWIPTSVGKSGDPAASTALPDKTTPPAAAANEAPVAEKSHARSVRKPARVAANSPSDAAGYPPPPPPPAVAAARCAECGVVESVHEVETQGKASGLGAVGGAVAGGVLGNQIGAGRGRDVMTVVGAVGGALAGNQIEKKVKSTKSYQVTVRLQDGTSRVFTEANPPAWRQGDKVKVVGNRIEPQG